MGDVVIDTTGDLDVAAAAGAHFIEGTYIVTTVFRLGGVDTDAAERFRREEPEAFAKLDRQAKRMIGGSWDFWWLKTPLPGVVWCNCPHMTGYDGLKVEDLTQGRLRGPQAHLRPGRLRARATCRASRRASSSTSRRSSASARRGCWKASTSSPRTTCMDRVHFADTVARGRDYYTPYRAMLPKEVDGLLVAGPALFGDEPAQKMSREIPPCMSMGQSAGVAAALAVCAAASRPRRSTPRAICARVRAQGGDPGDVPSANANMHGERRVTRPPGPAARRHPRRRLHPGDDGPGGDAGARRLRRRRDQDRAAGDGRPLAHLRSRTTRPGSRPGLLLAQPQQALDRARPAQARSARGRCCDLVARRRRGREQFPRRRHGAHGLRLRGAARRSTRASSTPSAPASASPGLCPQGRAGRAGAGDDAA